MVESNTVKTSRTGVRLARSTRDSNMMAPPWRSLRAQGEPSLPTDPRFRSLAFLAVLAACGESPDGQVDEFSRADAADSACPTHLDMTLLAESARSESGWTGRAYGIGPPAGAYSTVEIVECDEECRRCRFRGPVRGDQPVVHQRCLNDVRKTCSRDDECGEGGSCRFMWPPFNGLSVCDLLYFEPTDGPDPSPVRGVFDFATGHIDFDVQNIRVGVSLTGACGDCRQDREAGDGVTDGVCTNTEAACDVAGTQALPPGSTSYECAPHSFVDLSFGVPAGGASTTPTFWTMDETRPRCTVGEFSSMPCWCGVCTESAEPCFSDDQCGPESTCGWAGPDPEAPVYRVAPDSCAESCDWNEETQSGTCLDAGGIEVGCLPRSGSIEVRASAAVLDGYYLSTLGLLTCVPATGNPLIDDVSGLPGPLYFRAGFEVRPRFR